MRHPLLTALRARWHYVTGRYRAVPVDRLSLVRACEDLLRRVRAEELGRCTHPLDVELFREDRLLNDSAIALVDTHSGRVVGTVRATRMSLLRQHPELAPDFQFDDALLGDLASQAFLCHRLAIEPAHRRSCGSLVLMQKLYSLGIEQRAALCMIDCEPPLAPLYERLGFRAVGRPYTRDGVVFIAMVLVNYDIAHLQRLGSPLLSTWKKMGRPSAPETLDWRATMEDQGLFSDNGFRRVDPNEPTPSPLFRGLSPAGRRALLTRATRLEFAPGQRVIAAGEPARWMGFVDDGTLEVEVDGGSRDDLGSGDLVGAVGFLLNTPRTANVHAGPAGATMSMLTPSALQRVRDPADRAQLWQNLTLAIARRVDASSQAARAHPQAQRSALRMVYGFATVPAEGRRTRCTSAGAAAAAHPAVRRDS